MTRGPRTRLRGILLTLVLAGLLACTIPGTPAAAAGLATVTVEFAATQPAGVTPPVVPLGSEVRLRVTVTCALATQCPPMRISYPGTLESSSVPSGTVFDASTRGVTALGAGETIELVTVHKVIAVPPAGRQRLEATVMEPDGSRAATASVTIQVPAPPPRISSDLEARVELEPYTGWLVVGQEMRVSIAVRNYGPATAAAGWSLTYTVPDNVRIVTPDPGCPPATACIQTAPLGVSGQRFVNLVVEGVEPGRFEITATVSPAPGWVDPDTSNNVHSSDVDLRQPASVGGVVWWDMNADGVRDPEDEPAAGVTVIIYSVTDEPAGPVVTRADGSFLIRGVNPFYGIWLPALYLGSTLLAATKQPMDLPDPNQMYSGPGLFEITGPYTNLASPPDKWIEFGVVPPKPAPSAGQTSKPVTTSKPPAPTGTHATSAPARASASASSDSQPSGRMTGGSRDGRRIAATGTAVDPWVAGLGLSALWVGAGLVLSGRRSRPPDR